MTQVIQESPQAINSGVVLEIMTEQSVLGTISKVAALEGLSYSIVLYVRAISSGLPGVPLTNGTVIFECASEWDFAGTWAPLHSFDLTTIDVDGDSNSGEIVEFDLPFVNGPVRARISEGVTGGTVTVRILKSNWGS